MDILKRKVEEEIILFFKNLLKPSEIKEKVARNFNWKKYPYAANVLLNDLSEDSLKRFIIKIADPQKSKLTWLIYLCSNPRSDLLVDIIENAPLTFKPLCDKIVQIALNLENGYALSVQKKAICRLFLSKIKYRYFYLFNKLKKEGTPNIQKFMKFLLEEG